MVEAISFCHRYTINTMCIQDVLVSCDDLKKRFSYSFNLSLVCSSGDFMHVMINFPFLDKIPLQTWMVEKSAAQPAFQLSILLFKPPKLCFETYKVHHSLKLFHIISLVMWLYSLLASGLCNPQLSLLMYFAFWCTNKSDKYPKSRQSYYLLLLMLTSIHLRTTT